MLNLTNGSMIIMCIIVIILSLPHIYMSQNAFIAILPVELVIPLILLLAPVVVIAARQRLVITDDGMTLYRGGRRKTIRWEEARLFSLPSSEARGGSITRAGSPQGIENLPIYELASERAIIRWEKINADNVARSSEQGRLTRFEYNMLINRLNTIVVARTGLPLYDLRNMD